MQPGWLSEGGQMMPMEKTRAGMLARAEQGLDPESKKVWNMARALRHDPQATVLDRHHAKYFEDPENVTGLGHTALDPTVGIFPGDERYDQAAAVVQRAAERSGEPPREFLANVWAGVRDKLMKGEDIYGMQHPRAAMVRNESFANSFRALIDRVAAQRRISVSQLFKQLKEGDTALMSALLASPLMLQFMAGEESQEGQI